MNLDLLLVSTTLVGRNTPIHSGLRSEDGIEHQISIRDFDHIFTERVAIIQPLYARGRGARGVAGYTRFAV